MKIIIHPQTARNIVATDHLVAFSSRLEIGIVAYRHQIGATINRDALDPRVKTEIVARFPNINIAVWRPR